jgi:hypothetical protein
LSPASDALIQCVDDFKTLGLEEIVLAHVIYVANTPGLEEMLAEEARLGHVVHRSTIPVLVVPGSL